MAIDPMALVAALNGQNQPWLSSRMQPQQPIPQPNQGMMQQWMPSHYMPQLQAPMVPK